MAEKSIRVLLTGGGTGGHIYPAIVIADEIRLMHPDVEILFVGTQRGLESKVLPRLGYNIEFVDVRFFKRSLSIKNIVTLYKAVTSVLQARRIIKSFKPDVVVGTGGYVSGPVVLAASLAKVPTLIHEQNAYPGLTTRLLARRVDKVAVSHADAIKRIASGARTVVTGHPVRREFFETDRESARREMDLKPEQKLVLVVGGSGGAEMINRVTLDCAAAILANPNNILLHATGNRYFPWASEEKQKLNLNPDLDKRYRLVDYIHDIPRVMAASDLIVARSGGMVHEMTATGCPALLIPSPNVTDDHQLYNARSMVNAGAAVLIEERLLSTEKLSGTILELLADQAYLDKLTKAAIKLGKPEAGNRLAKLVFQMAKKNIDTNQWG
jgi:UDP-N-acetylglucosamine--N-acetylmuramyl-(pentapeptide) pyrophosphoryl-undecaprenol N-acetylglucosamine transferase